MGERREDEGGKETYMRVAMALNCDVATKAATMTVYVPSARSRRIWKERGLPMKFIESGTAKWHRYSKLQPYTRVAISIIANV